MKKYISIIVLSAGALSCTDLDEQVYSSVLDENFYKTEKQALATAGPAYSNLRAYPNPENIWGLNELTADAIVLPTRGNNWYNGGIFQRLHKHEWNASEGFINNAWNLIYTNINNCNRVMHQFDLIEDKSEALESIMQEMRGLRGFNYYLGLDLFGNIPIIDRFDVPAGFAPSKAPREEVFNFIAQELTSSIPSLSKEADMTTYGRFNRWAAYATLAKLYLNAEVYTGRAMWDECIAACDSIIDAQEYNLSNEFFSNFGTNNENSPENIFVIPYDNKLPQDWGGNGITSRMFQLQYWTLYMTSSQTFNMQQGGWNGFCALPSFYNSYDPTDVRLNSWLVGPQFTASGEPLKLQASNEQLVYTVDVTSLESAADNEGARLVKYNYTGAQNFTLNNDFAIFRYADVLLMKAEALMRKNAGTATQQAVDLVNAVRARAFEPDEPYTVSTLTLDALLAERGWELAGEGWRRNDLIRFDKFDDPWQFKPNPSPSFRTIFPIPQNQLNANPNLVQNDGY
jgi:hypothetical protein